MSTTDDPSPIRYGLKRSDAMEFDRIDDNMTFGTLKSEDSGIVLGNGLQSPDEETKDMIADAPPSSVVDGLDGTQRTGNGRVGGIKTGSRRRSSAGTYSSVEDDDDDNDDHHGNGHERGKTGGNGAWLSDDDGNADDSGSHTNEHKFDPTSAMNIELKGNEDDRLSVGSSPAGDKGDSSPDQEKCESPKFEEPRVDFQKGVRCTDVIRAIEILMTRYRLPDVTLREHHRHWSSWGPAVYSGYGSRSFMRVRRQFDAPEESKELKAICQSIERRHHEISEILQKLLELDAANRAEAEALVRLPGAGSSATGDSGLGSPGVGPGSAAAAVNPSSMAADDANDGNQKSDNTPTLGQSRSLKRRNPFTRAVNAIRKRFSRPQQSDQQAVPAAA